MKVIIDHKGIKREIDGSFQLCLGAGDAGRLIKALQEHYDDGGYGWVEVPDQVPASAASTEPIPWDEARIEMESV